MAVVSRVNHRAQQQLFMYVASISLTTLVVGFALGFSSPALPDMRSRNILTAAEASWFASLLTLGGMIGSLMSSFTMDKLGRRGSLQLANGFFVLSYGIICFFEDPKLLYCARLFAGASGGLVFAAAPAYISEISTNDLRGTLGSCTQLAITIGIALAFMVDSFFRVSYVVLSAVGLVLSCVASCALIPVFDSPQWYLAQRRRHLALAALTLLRGSSEAAESEISGSESTGSKSAADSETFAPGDLGDSRDDLITSTVVRGKESGFSFLQSAAFCKPIMVSVGLMAIQQFTGINAVLFYASDILRGTQNAFAEQYGGLLIAIAQVMATVLATSLMERSGRKQLLRASLIVMAVGCFMLAAGYSSPTSATVSSDLTVTSKSTSSWAGLAVLALLVYIVGFSVGCGPIPMIIMSEIFEIRHRAVACGVTIFANWFFGFVITLYFDSLADSLGRATVFFAFGAVSFAGIVFTWRWVPETRGKTLEEIQLFFTKGK